MANQPLTRWRCDVCGEWITSDQNGYVVWHTDEGGVFGFQIIHQAKCDDRSAPRSNALRDFLGPDGAAYLTAFLSLGPAHPGIAPARMTHLDDWVDFFRRVQLPYYEEARSALRQGAADGDFSSWSESAPYLQDSLQRLARQDG